MLPINILLLVFIKSLHDPIRFWKGGVALESTGGEEAAGSCPEGFQALWWLRGPAVQDRGGICVAPRQGAGSRTAR